MAIDDKAVVYTELPIIKHWRFALDYAYEYFFFFENKGTWDIDMRKWKFISATELRATTDGHLYPHLHDLEIEVSKSKLKHPDPLS